MRRLALAACVISACFCFVRVFADTNDTGWKKVTKQQLESVTVEHGSVRVNNLTLSEEASLLQGNRNTLKFSCSGRNSGSNSAGVQVQLIGYDKSGAVVFALSAQPSLFTISAGKVDQISTAIRTPEGTMEKTLLISYRIIIDE